MVVYQALKTMAKYKADKIKVLDTLDVFELFMLVSLIMMSIGMSIDIYNIYKNKKQFGCIKFKMKHCLR